MRFVQLRYFLEVCKKGNMTRAAASLHVSQPTVTTAIRDLEEELGVNLFHRIKQRIYLTNEGNYFLNELEPIINQLDMLVGNMNDLGNKKNHVKVGIPPMMGSFLFPDIFAGFRAAHPEIKLEIYEYGALEIQKLVADEVLDLAIMIEEGLTGQDITYKTIRKTYFRFYTNQNHRFADKESLAYVDLKGEPLVMFGTGFYINQVITSGFEKAGITPNIVLLTSQINTIKRFVTENIASTFLIEDCVTPGDNLKMIALDDPSPATIVIGWKTGRHLYSDAVRFVKFVDNLYQNKTLSKKPG